MNTTELIASVKSKASMPDSQSLWTPETILETLNEEMNISMLPLMMRIQEDYFLDYISYPTFQKIIPIPSKAIGTKIRSLGFYKEDYLVAPVARVDEENSFVNYARGFVFENYSAKLLFDTFPSTDTELRLYYYKRPNSLALETDVSAISSIDTLTNKIITGSALSFYQAGSKIDIQTPNNPYSLSREGLEIISVNGAEIELLSVEGLNVGDYVCLQGKSFFPNIPEELHSLLAQRVAVKVLEANGSQQEMVAAQGIYTQMERDAIFILTPRADGTTTKFIPRRGIGSYVG